MNDVAIFQLLNGSDVEDVISSILVEGIEEEPGRQPRIRRGLSAARANDILRANLKKGDVVVVGPARNPKGRTIKNFYRVMRKLFKDSKNVHVDLYKGRGRVVTAIAGKTGVVNRKLSRLSPNRNHITVLRPLTSKRRRNAALRFANKQVGKPYSHLALVGAGVQELAPRVPIWGMKAKKDSFTCSGLVAQAYPSLDVRGRKRNLGLVAPKDFRRSPDFDEVLRMDRVGKKSKFRVRVKRKYR